MPIFPPPPFGSGINLFKGEGNTIGVTYLYGGVGATTTYHNPENVTIQVDFEQAVDDYPVFMQFNSPDGTVINTVNTTLSHIYFYGDLSTDEDDYYAKVQSLFANVSGSAASGDGTVITNPLLRFRYAPTDEFYTDVTAGDAAYTQNNRVKIPNGSGFAALSVNNVFANAQGNISIATSGNRNIDGGSATSVYTAAPIDGMGA